jgi:exopolysaccharide biosynthesis polyprenyl glycosylphosphotransferase
LIDISLAGLFGNLIILLIYKKNIKINKKNILLIDEKNKFQDITFLTNENEKIERINFINSKNEQQFFKETNFSNVIILDDILKENSEKICKEMISKGISIMSLVKWFEFNFNRIPPDMINVVKYYESRSIPTDKTFEKRLKRVGDILFSLFLIIITSPIVLILIILIKLEDRGSIFYTQIRSGFQNKPFKLWKFRSMRENSEKSGPQWAQANDKRVTKIGFIMRKTRLDEIPQLLNVLLGDMSLIGPRPERPEIDSELIESINLYLERYTIRPGLSGWAQVNYPYGASIEDSKNKLSFDLFYIKNFSFWLDIAIAFKTIKIVLNAKGAYPKMKNEK